MVFPKSFSPFLAILEVDLRSMLHSWLVRGWVLLMAAQLLITIPSAAADGVSTSSSLAGLIGTFPIIWSTFVILVCSGSVTSESGVIADSILSKSVTRYQYILAKFSSRLIIVLGLYLLIAIPGSLLLASNTQNDMTNMGAVWGVLSIGMIMLFLTSFSVGLSTFFSRTLVALMVVWVVWYFASGLFAILQLDFLSPLSIVDNMEATLQGDYKTLDQVKIVAIFALLSIGTIGGAVSYFAHKDL